MRKIGTLLGLEYLHKQGVAHGNLKCSNMLIDAKGNTRLGDYNLPNSIRKLGLKAVGGRDPRWQPSEVGEHTAPEKRSDIWSLGCCLFEMLSAAAPFESEKLESDHQVRTFVACQLNEQKIDSMLAMIEKERIEGMQNVSNLPAPHQAKTPMGTITPELKDFLKKCLNADALQRPTVRIEHHIF